MAKGTAVRHREKKKYSSSSHVAETKISDNSSSSDVSPNHRLINENLRDQNLWRYCIFAIILSVGSISLFCLKDSELFSRTWSSIKARTFYQVEDVELPCNYGDDFAVDHRANLRLEEFVRCYDAKRYKSYEQFNKGKVQKVE